MTKQVGTENLVSSIKGLNKGSIEGWLVQWWSNEGWYSLAPITLSSSCWLDQRRGPHSWKNFPLNSRGRKWERDFPYQNYLIANWLNFQCSRKNIRHRLPRRLYHIFCRLRIVLFPKHRFGWKPSLGAVTILLFWFVSFWQKEWLLKWKYNFSSLIFWNK